MNILSSYLKSIAAAFAIFAVVGCHSKPSDPDLNWMLILDENPKEYYFYHGNIEERIKISFTAMPSASKGATIKDIPMEGGENYRENIKVGDTLSGHCIYSLGKFFMEMQQGQGYGEHSDWNNKCAGEFSQFSVRSATPFVSGSYELQSGRIGKIL